MSEKHESSLVNLSDLLLMQTLGRKPHLPSSAYKSSFDSQGSLRLTVNTAQFQKSSCFVLKEAGHVHKPNSDEQQCITIQR